MRQDDRSCTFFVHCRSYVSLNVERNARQAAPRGRHTKWRFKHYVGVHGRSTIHHTTTITSAASVLACALPTILSLVTIYGAVTTVVSKAACAAPTPPTRKKNTSPAGVLFSCWVGCSGGNGEAHGYGSDALQRLHWSLRGRPPHPGARYILVFSRVSSLVQYAWKPPDKQSGVGR